MISPKDFDRIKHDSNGNPKYVIHFTSLLKKEDYSDVSNNYENVLKIARTLGGRKYNNKNYAGGIVFQSYNLQDTCNFINEAFELTEENNPKNDLRLLESLYYGDHLSKKELQRAKELVHKIDTEVKNRVF